MTPTPTTRADADRSRTGQPVACTIESPLGPLLAAASERGVCLLEFVDRHAPATRAATRRPRFVARIRHRGNAHLEQLQTELRAYFAGERRTFGVPLDASGTPFQARVWDALCAIPCGRTRSYLDVARQIGRPTATRAVARANGDNPVAILIPCHRVIGSDGTLTGYAGGLWRKRWLLEHERAMTDQASEGLFGGALKAGPRSTR